MKTIDAILRAFVALMVNALMGAVMASLVGAAPLAGAGAGMVLGTLLSGMMHGSGLMMAGVLTEVWTGELVKKLRSGLEGSWLDGIHCEQRRDPSGRGWRGPRRAHQQHHLPHTQTGTE